MLDYRDRNDPLLRNTADEPLRRRHNAGWAWLAAAVSLVIVLAIAFGVGHEPYKTSDSAYYMSKAGSIGTR